MFQPYFSKAAIQRLESMIDGKIEQFLGVLARASSGEKALDMSLGFSCLTADVVLEYCNQKSLGALSAPDFRFAPIMQIEEAAVTFPYGWYIPNVVRVVTQLTGKLPLQFQEKYLPPVAAVNWVLAVR